MVETVYINPNSKIVGKTVEEVKAQFGINILFASPRDKVLVFSWEKKRPRKTRKIKVDDVLEVEGRTRQITALQKARRKNRFLN